MQKAKVAVSQIQYITDETMKEVISGIANQSLTKDTFYPVAYGSLWASNVTRLYTANQMREISLAWDEKQKEVFNR